MNAYSSVLHICRFTTEKGQTEEQRLTTKQASNLKQQLLSLDQNMCIVTKAMLSDLAAMRHA